MLQFFLRLDLADHLCHSAHGAEGAPCSGLEQCHDRQTDDGGGQHDAVKAKAVLCDPVRQPPGGVGPAPGHPERPEQLNCFRQGLGPGTHQIGLEHHIAEHGQEENEKAIPEPLGGHPPGCRLISGALAVAADLRQKLTPAAVAVAEGLVSANHRNAQRHQKIDHPQPGKENVEESQSEIEDCPDP